MESTLTYRHVDIGQYRVTFSSDGHAYAEVWVAETSWANGCKYRPGYWRISRGEAARNAIGKAKTKLEVQP